MRIIVVISRYHPALNPNVYRWSAIAQHWQQQGHEVHVLCSRRLGYPDEQVMDGVFVHRAGQNSLLDAIYNILKIKKRRGEAGGDSPKRKGTWRLYLEKIADYTWRLIYWPDGRCLWYLPARRKLMMLLSLKKYDAVISVGLPFTAHLIAQYAKKHHPALQWMMDIEDPFCFSEAFFVNNFALYRQLNVRAERKAFEMADVITLTASNARSRYEALFPQATSRMQLVLPLFDLPELEKEGIPLQEAGHITHLGYFGAFYRKIRTPDAFLELLAGFISLNPEWEKRLLVHFFGEIDAEFLPAFERYPQLAGILKFHGLAPRQAVAKAMLQMDVLINIGNTTDYHLPSKCADYLASRKPIISLSYTENDPFTEFFKDYPMLWVVNARQALDGNVAQLCAFLQNNKGKRVPKEMTQPLLETCRVESIAGQYLGLLAAPS